MKNNKDVIEGEVLELLPGGTFKIKLANEKEVIGYPSGKIRLNHIKILIGDKVHVVVDPYGGKVSNRVVKRLEAWKK